MNFEVRKMFSTIANFFQTRVKGVFLKFGVEVGVEESIVNEPLVLKTLIFQIAD
jgi:P2-related tail formation protein